MLPNHLCLFGLFLKIILKNRLNINMYIIYVLFIFLPYYPFIVHISSLKINISFSLNGIKKYNLLEHNE